MVGKEADMTDLAKKYLDAGGPTKISLGEYVGHLEDVEIVLGLMCGIYRFPGGLATCGPAIMLDKSTPNEKGEDNELQS